jgi:hypothetical protein
MSQNFVENALTFRFPDSWRVCRPQKAAFYVGGFQGFCASVTHALNCPAKGGSKEMDFVAYDPADNILWLIEVKDFRLGGWSKPLDLIDQITLKTRDTLALLTAGTIIDQTPAAAPPAGQPVSWQVGDFGRNLTGATRIRVVLHCELQPAASTLFPNQAHAANLSMKLTQQLQVIDPAPIFSQIAQPGPTPWQVA